MSKEDFDEFVEEAGKRCAKDIEDGQLEKAGDLLLAGWSPEPVYPDGPMLGWKWRRPGKRGGRLFHSTDQAFNHLTLKATPVKV